MKSIFLLVSEQVEFWWGNLWQSMIQWRHWSQGKVAGLGLNLRKGQVHTLEGTGPRWSHRRVADGWWYCPQTHCRLDAWTGVLLNCASRGMRPTVGEKTLRQRRLSAFHGIILSIHCSISDRWWVCWKASSEVFGRQPEEGPGQHCTGLQMCLRSPRGNNQLQRERSGLVPSHGRGGHLQEATFFFFFFAQTHFPLVISQLSSHQFIFKGTWLRTLCQGECAAAANVTFSPLWDCRCYFCLPQAGDGLKDFVKNKINIKIKPSAILVLLFCLMLLSLKHFELVSN